MYVMARVLVTSNIDLNQAETAEGSSMNSPIQTSPEAFIASREQLELGMAVAGLGLGAVDYRADTITLDTRAASLFELPPNISIQRSALHGRIHPEDRPEIDRQLKCLLDPTGDSFVDIKHRIIRDDETIVWVQARKLVEFEPGEPGQKNRPKSGIVAILDITELKTADTRIQMLLGEVNHRAKNLLSVVQSIARMTARSGDVSTFVDRFSDRLSSLAANQDLIVSDAWTDVDLKTLVEMQLAPFADSRRGRIKLEGSPVRVRSNAAQAIGMAIHELATNATKYGALSNEVGKVGVSWSVSSGAEPELSVQWVESGGPTVIAPSKTGFGEKVIKRMAASALKGTVDLDYHPTGVIWNLRAPAGNTRALSAQTRI